MKSRHALSMLLVSALVLWPLGEALGVPASFSTRVIAGGGAFDFFDQQGQDLNGRYLVYESRNLLIPGSMYNLYVYDRSKDRADPLYSAAGWTGNRTNASVWNGLVAYEDDTSGTKDIRLNDLWGASGTDALIAGGPGDQMDPHIQDNVVVWHSGTDVYFRDLHEGVNHKVPTGLGSQGNLGTSRGYIYYQDSDAVSPDVYRYDHAREDTECLSGNLVGPGNWAGDLAAHDDIVVWRANRFSWPNTAIRAYEVRAGLESTVAHNSIMRKQPDVFWRGGYAWVDDAGGTEGVRALVFGYSPASVIATTTTMGDPSMYGRSVAFGPGYDVWLAEHPTPVSRVAGTNRYETAAAMSRRHFTASKLAVLASGEDWPDGLSAAGLAGALDCPLLLVRKDSIPAATFQEIARLGATDFMIVGGTAAVSAAVMETLKDEFGEFSVRRVGGVDRYATAVGVAYWIADITGMAPDNPTFSHGALFVSGASYADALAAAPLSAARHMPILLVRPSSPTPVTLDAISDLPLDHGVVVGGTAAVSSGVKTQIDARLTANPGGAAAERWYGINRYGTARMVADNAVRARWLDLDALGLTTGTNFADALGAGAALGSHGSPLILTHPATLSTEARNFLSDWSYDIGELQVAGGTSAVSAAVVTSAASRLAP